MRTPSPDAVDAYLENVLLGQDEVLEDTLARSQQMGLVPHAVSPLQGAFLHTLIKAIDAKRILEIGCLGGYSAIWMARALPEDGNLISMEIIPSVRAVALQNIKDAGLDHKIKVILGEAKKIMDSLIEENQSPFDLIFIDADKVNNSAYWSRALQLSKTGTVIIVDNIVRDGKLIDENSIEHSVVGSQRVLKDIQITPGVTATAMQTVGAKGWDGFAMAVIDDVELARS